jgi:hypothetical protein
MLACICAEWTSSPVQSQWLTFKWFLLFFLRPAHDTVEDFNLKYFSVFFSVCAFWLVTGSAVKSTSLMQLRNNSVYGALFDNRFLPWRCKQVSWWWLYDMSLAATHTHKRKNSMVWVREWTIPTERPPLSDEVIDNFLRIEGATWSAWRIPMAVFSVF